MNEERLLQVLRAPHVSEKSARLQGEGNQYVFRVARDATKPEIRAAVELVFKVDVEKVNTLRAKGKTKSFRFRRGRQSDWKKAFVRLKAGQTIDFGKAES